MIGGFRDSGKFRPLAAVGMTPRPAPEKEFSKTVLTGEQTFDHRELSGKMLPGFAECSFSACGCADGSYVLCSEWNIACVNEPGHPL
jgi:hypothetical protein